MPAIEFNRLRTKIDLLGRVYEHPDKFVKDLEDLYFFYSDLTFQKSPNAISSVYVLNAYRTPVIITRELERAMKGRAESEPEKTLQICERLWQTKTLEPCQLAAALLGSIPVDFSTTVLETIRVWSKLGENFELIQMLHDKATLTIRKTQPELWLNVLRGWQSSEDVVMRKFALLGVSPFLCDPDFNNLPLLFDYLHPVFSAPDGQLSGSLLSVLEQLAAKSEPETVYYLKQILRESKSAELPRFIRRAYPFFSESAQTSIKKCLQDNLANK